MPKVEDITNALKTLSKVKDYMLANDEQWSKGWESLKLVDKAYDPSYQGEGTHFNFKEQVLEVLI